MLSSVSTSAHTHTHTRSLSLCLSVCLLSFLTFSFQIKTLFPDCLIIIGNTDFTVFGCSHFIGSINTKISPTVNPTFIYFCGEKKRFCGLCQKQLSKGPKDLIIDFSIFSDNIWGQCCKYFTAVIYGRSKISCHGH